MSGLAVPALIGVGVVLAMDDDARGSLAVPPPATPRATTVPSSATPALAGRQTMVASRAGAAVKLAVSTKAINAYTGKGAGAYTNQGEQTAAQVLRDATERAKNEYNKLGQAAKREAAKRISEQLGINPPLDGTETWEKLAKIAGGAAGGAACGAIPGAQVAVPLCSIVGAYFGVKLQQWVGKSWDKVEDWAEDKWDDVQDDIVGAAGDAYDYIKGLF